MLPLVGRWPQVAFSANFFDFFSAAGPRRTLDAFSVLPGIDISGGFGKYSKTLTRLRVMEFALRYSF